MEEAQLMFNGLAKYYDLIYSAKGYQQEVDGIVNFINRYKNSPGNDLLDIACGTGQHLYYLKKYFNCIGMDASQDMLEIAQSRNPELHFQQSSMIQFNLNQKFDVITCLFTAIGYVMTLENLQKTFNNFASHLRSGGLVIIEPWFTRENLPTNITWFNNYSDENIKIARMGNCKLIQDISILELFYLVGEKNCDVQYFKEKHLIGMFEEHQILNCLQESGFSAKLLREEAWNDERGIYIGIKN